MKITKICLILLSFITVATSAEPLSEQALIAKAQAFIAAKNARQQPDSSEKDIDRFIALIADEFVDEHVKFKVTVTDKTELKNGMLAKLNDEIEFSHMEILDMMVGRNVVFVKYIEHAKGKPVHLEQFIEYSTVNLLSLEFNEKGLITHIRRHHGI